jgi:hypothetical protein
MYGDEIKIDVTNGVLSDYLRKDREYETLEDVLIMLLEKLNFLECRIEKLENKN